jgi:hypothetical protein
MSQDVTIYEAGIRINGEYCEFIQSKKKSDVDEYIEIMKTTKPKDGEIVKLIKVFRCISTTPHVIYD